MNGIALAKQQFCEVSAILPGDAGDQGYFAHAASDFWLGILTGPRQKVDRDAHGPTANLKPEHGMRHRPLEPQ